MTKLERLKGTLKIRNSSDIQLNDVLKVRIEHKFTRLQKLNKNSRFEFFCKFVIIPMLLAHLKLKTKLTNSICNKIKHLGVMRFKKLKKREIKASLKSTK